MLQRVLICVPVLLLLVAAKDDPTDVNPFLPVPDVPVKPSSPKKNETKVMPKPIAPSKPWPKENDIKNAPTEPPIANEDSSEDFEEGGIVRERMVVIIKRPHEEMLPFLSDPDNEEQPEQETQPRNVQMLIFSNGDGDSRIAFIPRPILPEDEEEEQPQPSFRIPNSVNGKDSKDEWNNIPPRSVKNKPKNNFNDWEVPKEIQPMAPQSQDFSLTRNDRGEIVLLANSALPKNGLTVMVKTPNGFVPMVLRPVGENIPFSEDGRSEENNEPLFNRNPRFGNAIKISGKESAFEPNEPLIIPQVPKGRFKGTEEERKIQPQDPILVAVESEEDDSKEPILVAVEEERDQRILIEEEEIVVESRDKSTETVAQLDLRGKKNPNFVDFPNDVSEEKKNTEGKKKD